MWYPSTVADSVAAPITLAEAKRHLRITGSDSDDLIQASLDAAIAQVEAYCYIRLGAQSLVMRCDAFTDFVRLPDAPLQSIASVTYVDTFGVTQTLPASVYELRSEGLAPSIVLKPLQTWPVRQAGTRITVSATAGWATLPPNIRAAVLLTLSRVYAVGQADMQVVRERVDGVGEVQMAGISATTAAITDTVRDILEPYRNWPLS